MRALFVSKEKQREFFVNVKGKTQMGSRKLSTALGLKSRGMIENYTSGRTSPDLEIVRRLEKMTGVKGEYKETSKKRLVIRPFRNKTFCMEPRMAEKILRARFKDDYDEVLSLIAEENNISSVENELRKRGYRFDNAVIMRALGTMKIARRLGHFQRFEEKDCQIIDGYVQLRKNSFSVSFSLNFLHENIRKKKCKIGYKFNPDFSKVRIFPLNNGMTLAAYSFDTLLRFWVRPCFPLNSKKNIKVCINPQEFGFDFADFVQDYDARRLAKKLIEKDFTVYPVRSTNTNAMGDLVVTHGNKTLMIEITRAIKQQAANWKLGQAFLHRFRYPNFINFIVVRKDFFGAYHIQALKELKITPIFSDFRTDWESETASLIENALKMD